jgi:1-acyl-sn-glycerol-3-phosphate acyltransferase
MRAFWYKILTFFITKIYFRKITLLGNTASFSKNPVLFLALHKNGAVDGWVYSSVLPPVEVLVAAQLTKNTLLRLFFGGIEVVRDKDGVEKRGNMKALNKCVSVLENGKNLLIFPEGTSTLGPKHLEFKKGAALTIKKYLAKTESPITVIPLGIFYDDPTHMGGKVEIIAGQEIDISSRETDIIHHNITLGLESVGINVETEEELKNIQDFAAAASMHDEVSYSAAIFYTLKKYRPLPQFKGIFKYKNLYLQPKNIHTSLWTFIITAPFVIFAFVFNVFPIMVGYICGKKFPDDKNIISLWRIIPGGTAFMLWAIIVIILGKIYGILALCLSFLGFTLYGAFKKHFISIANYFNAPGQKKIFDEIRNNAIKQINEQNFTS